MTPFSKGLRPFIAGGISGSTASFLAQIMTEFVDFAVYKKPFELYDSAGRVGVATFGGFVLGGITATIYSLWIDAPEKVRT